MEIHGEPFCKLNLHIHTQKHIVQSLLVTVVTIQSKLSPWCYRKYITVILIQDWFALVHCFGLQKNVTNNINVNNGPISLSHNTSTGPETKIMQLRCRIKPAQL